MTAAETHNVRIAVATVNARRFIVQTSSPEFTRCSAPVTRFVRCRCHTFIPTKPLILHAIVTVINGFPAE
jgi:hypothetical protein